MWVLALLSCCLLRLEQFHAQEARRLFQHEKTIDFVTVGKRHMKEFEHIRDNSKWVHLETDQQTGIESYGANVTTLDGDREYAHMVKGTSPYPAFLYYHLLDHRMETIPDWSTIVKDFKLLQDFGNNTKLVTIKLLPQTLLELPARLFVNLMTTNIKRVGNDNEYIATIKSVNYHGPGTRDRNPLVERGRFGINGIQASRSKKDHTLTEAFWISIIDLNYPQIKNQDLIRLYIQANMRLFVEEMLDTVKTRCEMTSRNCGVSKKSRRN